MGGNNCDELTQLTMSQYGFGIGDIVDVFEALGRPQISLVLRVRNMLEIVLGVLVVISFFVFWCDVMDSWNEVLNKR